MVACSARACARGSTVPNHLHAVQECMLQKASAPVASATCAMLARTVLRARFAQPWLRAPACLTQIYADTHRTTHRLHSRQCFLPRPDGYACSVSAMLHFLPPGRRCTLAAAGTRLLISLARKCAGSHAAVRIFAIAAPGGAHLVLSFCAPHATHAVGTHISPDPLIVNRHPDPHVSNHLLCCCCCRATSR